METQLDPRATSIAAQAQTDVSSETEKSFDHDSSVVVQAIGQERRKAWASLLTSVASAEGSERDLMRPLVDYFREFGLVSHDLNKHEKDEARHFTEITDYVWKTFAHRKQKRSISDRVIYEGAFVRLKKFARRRPLPFILALYFYEVFSAQFYSSLRKQAQKDQLVVLAKLIASIEKDELRHHAGLKSLLVQMAARGIRADWIDTAAAKFMILLVCADIDLRAGAIYNRHVRKNTALVGLDLQAFRENVLHARLMAFKELERMRTRVATKGVHDVV